MTECLDSLYIDEDLHPSILELRNHKLKEKSRPEHEMLRSALSSLEPFVSQHCKFNGPEVVIGDRSELSDLAHARLVDVLKLFRPWKKGPFRIFGNSIDAEWRSDWKWGRILPHCPSLEGKVIADIGAHNGYYMFRMLAESPKLVIGFEPVVRHWYCFDFLQSFVQAPSLRFEPLGVEHVDLFPEFFDVIFCLGILYHHTDPVGLLQKMRLALKPEGSIIIDCQGVDHDDSIALVPKTTYAGGAGMWFLPSLSCLMNWIKRSGFREAVCFYQAPLSVEEQRATEWAPIKSLQDFLSPIDPQKTIEGYPRPWRFYIRAKK
jgi:tRNA (mo5U34)-methyltransferase